MFCSRCGQPLEEKDRFCPNCGWQVQDASQEEAPLQQQQEKDQQEPAAVPLDGGESGGQQAMPGPIPPAYPGPAAAPQKKNRWVIPVVVAAVVLVLILAVVLVGGILAYTIISNVDIDGGQTQTIPVEENGKELSGYLGLGIDELESGIGVVLTGYDDTYTNLDGSLMAIVEEETGGISTLVASDRDVGFTICGVSIGMDCDQAMSAAGGYVSDLEDFGDMIAGQNGDAYFSAYYDADGIVYYLMYFCDTEDSSTGTNASIGTGIWYIGEPLEQVWESFGEEYTLEQMEGASLLSYPAEGFCFGTTDPVDQPQSQVSYVEINDGAWFSDEIYLGMPYEDIAIFVALGETVEDTQTGLYRADFSMTLAGMECYGAFWFDGPDASSASVRAYIACDNLPQ